MRQIDLCNQKFGRWAVLSRAANTFSGQACWLCRCECGTERTLKSIVIRRGISQSCGCLKSEVTAKRSTKHGHSHEGGASPTYHSWSGMLARCSNPKNKHFIYYGGRGISVCDRWKAFANFLADMGEKPPGLSLDRIDPDGDYAPTNCRWATAKQQARNKSNNTIITKSGKSATIAEWSEITGLSQMTISYRAKHGWTPERVLNPSKQKPGPKRSAVSPR